jgi:PhnB protein
MGQSDRIVPEGYHSINPYLVVRNAAKAIEFYKKVFGAEERFRMHGQDGKTIMHADLKIGDSAFMLTEESTEMKTLSPESIGGSPVSMYLYVKDVDQVFNQAVSEGATLLSTVRDQFYGDRSGYLRDPFGHLWSVATHKKDLSPEELRKAAQAFLEEMSKTKTV